MPEGELTYKVRLEFGPHSIDPRWYGEIELYCTGCCRYVKHPIIIRRSLLWRHLCYECRFAAVQCVLGEDPDTSFPSHRSRMGIFTRRLKEQMETGAS